MLYIFALIASSNGTLSTKISDNSDDVLRDIKGFYSIEIPIWVWIALVTLFSILFGYLVYLRFLRKQTYSKLSVYEATVKALKELDLRKNSKDFYLTYSELIKSFLEIRLQVSVLDKTAEEIKECLINIPKIQTNQALVFAGIFQRADLAKFALKEISIEDKSRDIEQSLDLIRNIEETVIAEETKEREFKQNELK